MTSFSDLALPVALDTSANDLIRDFFNPMLLCAVAYDRGVGYFSSGWLRIAARGMLAFAEHGGRARWVTSPILDPADWEALRQGDAARIDPVLRKSIAQNIGNLEEALEEDTRSALAWMVADGILEFKLALPRNLLEQGDFHDKFGVFRDASGNRVSFNGSYNDSIQGTRNYESIKVFGSWLPAFAPLVQADKNRFEKLWCNLDPNVRVYELPEAAREQILQLRTGERPYTESERDATSMVKEETGGYRPVRPIVPGDLILRDYQLRAIDKWFSHDCRGLLEMATGSGKTITALAASVRLYERLNQLAVIIALPYQHLVDQWDQEARPFGYRGILAYKSTSQWRERLNGVIADYNAGYRRFLSIFVTHTTFISPEFQTCIERITGPALVIADEAHHLGSEQGRYSYPVHFDFRLALSATPDRWFDDVGTDALRAYFGETVFSYPLAQAIGNCLTPYRYYPRLVPLTDEEMEEYSALSIKIGRLAAYQDDDAQEMLKTLLMKRANLLNKAANKVPVLAELVAAEPDLHHALFYCAPGQIDNVTQLLGWNMGMPIHTFTAKESTEERQQLLKDFDTGDIQGLVAMKCLDEGVDVPSTRTAFILASSSNPREFIQRRGRVLRKYPGKEFAIVHDLLAVPPENWQPNSDDPVFTAERSMVRRELKRLKEFAEHALNKHQALDVVWDLAQRYGLRDAV